MHTLISILISFTLISCNKEEANEKSAVKSQAPSIMITDTKLKPPVSSNLNIWNELITSYKVSKDKKVLTEILDVKKNNSLDGEASQNYEFYLYRAFKVDPSAFLVEYKSTFGNFKDLAMFFAGESTSVDLSELKKIISKSKNEASASAIANMFEQSVIQKTNELRLKYE